MRLPMIFLFALILLPRHAHGSLDEFYVDGQICCIPEPGACIDEINARWGTVILESDSDGELYLLLETSPLDTPAFAALMSDDPDVQVAEPNYLLSIPGAVRMMVVPAIGGDWDDFVDQGLAHRIGLPQAHEISTGHGINVAVLDTGIDPDHEIFAGRILPQAWDFINNNNQPWEVDDGSGMTGEAFGHGTMVAGAVLLAAPDARILPLRVLNEDGWGTAFNIARATIWASVHGAHVINMSFGAPAWIVTIARTLHVPDLFGSFVVSGAGNRNAEEPPYYPGSDERVFMVTALDTLDVKAEFADYHELVDVSAPGTGVRTAYPGNDWALGSGCSFAVPLLSGEIALILEQDPGTSRSEMRARVIGGVDPICHIPGNSGYIGKLGSGRIHLPSALTGDAASAGGAIEAGVSLWVHPNPASGPVQILPGSLPPGSGMLEVLDPSGRCIRTLQFASGGPVSWDGKDAYGRPAPAGVYWLRVHPSSEAVRVVIVR